MTIALKKKKVYEVNQELGGGEFFPSACPGEGNRSPEKEKKCKSPGVCPGGMVTGQIAPCIVPSILIKTRRILLVR